MIDLPALESFSFSERYRDLCTHLNAIFFDRLKSKAPIALVIDETNSGTIKHFNILKNRSPGY